MKKFLVTTGLKNDGDKNMTLEVFAPKLAIGEKSDRVILSDRHGIEVLGVIIIKHGVVSIAEASILAD